jgi:Ca2+-binding EF-hand superfamily protein
MSKPLIAACAAALAAFAPPTWAEDDIQERIDARFAELDRDRDGFLSRLECSRMPGLLESFLKHDTDKDGKLNRDEFTRAAAPLIAANRR